MAAQPDSRGWVPNGVEARHLRLLVTVISLTTILAGCGRHIPNTDPELEALAETFGRTVTLVRGPVDTSDSIDSQAEDEGVVGEVRASTRHGRVLIRRYARWNWREAAEGELPPQGERHGDGFTAHAGCQDILFEFRGYDDPAIAVRHALVAIQMLEFAANGVCRRGEPSPMDSAPSAPDVFTLAVSATPSGPSSIAVQGITNLPDGAKITLLVSRALRLQGESDTRSTRVAGGATTVAGGTFSATLPIEDDDLLFLADPMQPVEALSSDVLVCAQFRTGEGDDGPIQPGDVSEVVGERGQNLRSSPNMSLFGSGLPEAEQEFWLEASTTVSQPPSATGVIAAQQGVAPTTEATLVPFCLA